MKSKRRKWLIFASIALVLAAALVIWIVWGNTALETTCYTISSEEIPDAFDGFRIAQVSDLHNAQMGSNNEKLLALLRESDPDIIAITGDLIDSRNTDVEVALDFAREALKIAPCYFVLGNHEARTPPSRRILVKELQAMGVTVLQNARVELEREGQTLTLLGVDDPTHYPEDPSYSDADILSLRLDALQQEDGGYTVLLSHRPELFDVYVQHGIDLALTGHAHGGQFRLPLIGGLAAPNQGLLPQYDAGLFQSESTSMIVSRGIGNSAFPFRINNRPELVLIELQSPASK